ncbi:MAG: hypothetical protein KDM81_03200, partial [Verrucomicrobiae bacterium]|nr:hypothetical protein [Verrucomicrobiae bacterium]
LGHQAIFRMQVVPALAGPGGPGFGFSLNDFMPGWYHERGILSRAVSLLFFTTSSGVNRGWNTGLTNVWSDVWAALPARSEHVWHQAAATLLLGCLVASFLILWIAARSVRSAWVEQPPSVAMERMRRKLLTPRYLTDLLQRRLRQTLESNPIGWLHQRSPNARMVKWGWVLAMILGEFLVLSESGGAGESRDLRNAQYLLALALLVGVAFSSAASFRHERENGAFELLLVTPLSVPALIWGRLAGIWRQFLPAAALLAIIQLLLRIWTFAMGRGHEPEVFFAGCFAVVPIVGLWLSMQRRGLLSAGLLTLLTGVVLPLLLVNTLSAFKLLGVNAANAGSTWLVFQGALGLFAFLHLDRALSERRFLSKQP